MALEKIKAYSEMAANMARGAADETKKTGGEDPRRISHAVKVGLAMAAVASIYYFDLFHQGYPNGSGLDAMWAINTVAAIFEFSIGATIGKGVNRTIATIIGLALGLGAHGATEFAGNTAESIMLAFIIFFICGAATFARFIPKLKARNEYCFLIINVTFGLIAVCTWRGKKLTEMAEKRLLTVLIGYGTVVACCCIWPCWAGEDLHILVATNIEKLGNFLQGFGGVYFDSTQNESQDMRALIEGCKTVINSKTLEESLVNFAKWEPRHGKFRYWHPWEHYLKIGALTRECACKIYAINGCLNSDMQAPLEIREKMKETCTEMSKVLRELAQGMKTMTRPTPADPHMTKAQHASDQLKSLMQTPIWGDSYLLDVCPATTVASLLIQVVSCTAKILESVHELASLSKFKNPNAITPDHDHDHDHDHDREGSESVTVIPIDDDDNNNNEKARECSANGNRTSIDVDNIGRNHDSSVEG